MPRVDMISNRSFTYGTRRLRAGDDFKAKRQDARVLNAVGIARKAPAPAQATRNPASPAAVDGDLAILRGHYTDATGKRPFMGWGADQLREKIAAHEAEAAVQQQPAVSTDEVGDTE